MLQGWINCATVCQTSGGQFTYWIKLLCLIGTDSCGVSSLLSPFSELKETILNCAYDVPKDSWEYHTNDDGWIGAKPEEVSVICRKLEGKVPVRLKFLVRHTI